MAEAERVAIVGVGLIGGSLGMAIRERGLASSVIGIGRNPATLERAIALGAIDTFTTNFEEGVAQASLVVLATPIPQILTDLARLPHVLAADAVVTDVGSIKEVIVTTGDQYLPGAFVGSHPMAGSEKAGVEAARADLFQGATWVVTPTENTRENQQQRIQILAEAVGSRLVILTPEAHDRAVALTSHLPHVLAYALASLAGERLGAEPQLADVAAGSFASVTRVAASSPELWQGICLTNRAALIESLRAYRAELDLVQAALEDDDSAMVLAAFERGYNGKKLYQRGE